jgi:hypothetical protein
LGFAVNVSVSAFGRASLKRTVKPIVNDPLRPSSPSALRERANETLTLPAFLALAEDDTTRRLLAPSLALPAKVTVPERLTLNRSRALPPFARTERSEAESLAILPIAGLTPSSTLPPPRPPPPGMPNTGGADTMP